MTGVAALADRLERIARVSFPISEETPSRTELAVDRTDLAEVRTELANGPTFAGWARAAIAAIGIGLAFKALFGSMQPSWAPKVLASIFILLSAFLIIMAETRAFLIAARIKSHSVKALKPMNIRRVAIGIGLGAFTLVAAIWLLI